MSKSVPYTRHNEMQPFENREGFVKALYYNHVQTGLHRLHVKLRYRIPKLKHLDLVLQKDAWIVVDRVLNDAPIIAWTDFETEHRQNLHEDIRCEIRLFHYAADMILDRTLEAMELMLGEELSEELNDEDTDDIEAATSSDVLPFKKNEDEDNN